MGLGFLDFLRSGEKDARTCRDLASQSYCLSLLEKAFAKSTSLLSSSSKSPGAQQKPSPEQEQRSRFRGCRALHGSERDGRPDRCHVEGAPNCANGRTSTARNRSSLAIDSASAFLALGKDNQVEYNNH